MANTGTNIAALVSYRIYPARMGGQKGIALFYRYLSQLLPVTIISTKNNEVPTGTGVTFIPLLGDSKLRYVNPFLYFSLRKILRSNHCTHLVLEHPYYGWLGILLKWFTGIKLVVHSHNIEALRFKSTGKWWWTILWNYERYVHRKAHINFFISDEDRQYAIQKFGLDASKCHTITYGFEINSPPAAEEKKEAKKKLRQIHGISDDEIILLFNGTLDYKPNQDAVDNILEHINPILLSAGFFKYRIIICGKGLPASYQELKEYTAKHIIYAGFVDDINVYFKGADIFINPVTDGGGIKTKLVEALGFNVSCVSSGSGAIGVPQHITGGKLLLAADSDWASFANAIIHTDIDKNIPAAYFDHFYWGNIAAKAKDIIA